MKKSIPVLLLVGLLLAMCAFGALAAPLRDGRQECLSRMRSLSSQSLYVRWDKRHAVVRSISGVLTRPGSSDPVEIARAFLQDNRSLFGLHEPEKDLRFSTSRSTPVGIFVRFRQKAGGLDVMGGGIILRILGRQVRTVVNNMKGGGRQVPQAELSPEQGAKIARDYLAIPVSPVKTTLLVLPWEGAMNPAYRVEFPFTGHPVPARYNVYVDAVDGHILIVDNRVMSQTAPPGSGAGVDGVVKSFPVYYNGVTFVLADRPSLSHSRLLVRTFSAGNTVTTPGTILTDSDNYWDDPAAVDAHYYGNYVMKYYLNNFGYLFKWYAKSGFRTSHGLVSTVHYDVNYENAFWDGNEVVYGDGGTYFAPLSGAIDVVAHEITHGVTESINHLIYCKESGALNESWSDVMGMFVSLDYGDDFPYWSGEEIMKIADTDPAYYAMRRLDDPPFRTDAYPANDYNPSSPLSSWGQPENTQEEYLTAMCNQSNDYGGVHINSGIPNKAAYLIVTNPDIGLQKAEQIYYYAMFYLSSTSRFPDARVALEQSATDLYGTGVELSGVRSAFDQVGVY
ncbi:MAG: peptidase M4 family protein [Deltaproteobacteria bacterium]|nr:peptidase M4 family protein [Deltaproteobacteria bacterium]